MKLKSFCKYYLLNYSIFPIIYLCAFIFSCNRIQNPHKQLLEICNIKSGSKNCIFFNLNGCTECLFSIPPIIEKIGFDKTCIFVNNKKILNIIENKIKRKNELNLVYIELDTAVNESLFAPNSFIHIYNNRIKTYKFKDFNFDFDFDF